MSERNDKKKIEGEDWKKAIGVKDVEGNPSLAERDYSIECNPVYVITIIKAYWLWWCSVHHQPLAWCEKAILESAIKRLGEDNEK